MLLEETYHKLSQMKMYGFAHALEEQLKDDNYNQLCFQERVSMLIDREHSEREARRLARRIKSAKLRQHACIEDIDYRHKRGLDRTLMARLAACEWLRNHHNLVIVGPTGVGKTYLCCALAQKACREGFSALYFRVSRFFQELLLARADGSYPKLMSKLARTDLLVLDDWGLTSLNAQQRNELFEVLEDRVGHRSTLIASQIPVKEWHDLIGQPTIADAILDRVIHNSYRIELTGESMRKKKSRLTEEDVSTTE